MSNSLFRAVDAGEHEAIILAKAERRARDEAIPRFRPSSLGFGRSSMEDFCSNVEPLILRLAADVSRCEKASMVGVGNLAIRDRVLMKEQILKGLLRDREDEDSTAEVTSGAEHLRGGAHAGEDSEVCGKRKRRGNLVNTGAVTPLDTSDDLTIDPAGRRRKTLQNYKIAEGMISPTRSHRVKKRLRKADRDLAVGRQESGEEPDKGVTSANISTPTSDGDNAGRGAGGATENAVECPLCAQSINVDDAAYPDACLSKHMDRCSRSTRRISRRPAREEVGNTTSDGRARDDGPNQALRGASNYPSAGKGKGRKTARAKRPSVTTQVLSHRVANSAEEVDVTLKVFGRGQPLVDDFDDGDFEARKVRDLDVSSATGVREENSSGSGGNRLELGDGLKLDGAIAERLFQFQVTGIRWMWQLHRQGAGGIVGDEMGLGKTVQVSAFLGALHSCNVMRRALILCPATVLVHWMAELHVWAPQLRVVILHRCVQAFNAVSGSSGRLRGMIRRILAWRDAIVVTSYEGVKSLKALLLPCNWDYCVLDEGQRIRNPDAEVTLICKQVRTVHRLVLTGTPIQNNLRELWSLFDFVFPGRLGTLPAFEAEFANPIRVGGYANASPMQVRLAYRCALVLRDLIHPYLLRRQKKDLESIVNLPTKTEQVLFCRLTSYQRRLYEEFLASTEVKSVMSRSMRAFRAIGILRKLCNHPDLVCRYGDSVVSRLAPHQGCGDAGDESDDDDDDLAEDSKGAGQDQVGRSGKLLVLQQILPLWHAQGHRVLLFSQTRQMLNIIERFVSYNGWQYGRLDGSTPVGTRQTLIDRFNTDESMFTMLLTTRTGGVGVNLIGADRVILFDPDWNPSTDMQARERSWRVGQLRQVTVYRLVTAGTIEEKIYHRQIFKTALTNRVLQDPKQRRIFSADELRDLFTLGDDGALDGFTDTVDLFQGEGRVDAPNGNKWGSYSSSSSEKETKIKKKNSRKSSGRQVRLGRGTPPRSSSLLPTTMVAPEPEVGDGGGKNPVEQRDRDVDKSKGDDNAVLQALYDGAPLSSVFHHDLAEGSGSMTAEQQRMEEAAKRAAQRAMNQLRMSRRTLRAGAGQGGFQSSWTGRNGGSGTGSSWQSARQVAGRRIAGVQQGTGRRFGTISNPSVADRLDANAGRQVMFPGQEESVLGQSSSGGLSSQDILRQIRLRNGHQPAPSPGLFPELEETTTPNDRDGYFRALLGRLQDLLGQSPSGVDTAALIQAFEDVPAADVPVFRQLLQAVATCAHGEWTLREAPSS